VAGRDRRDERLTMAEYGVIVSLVVLTAVTVLVFFAIHVGEILSLIATRIHE
jgi:Flp pilus assembly pilin Flp